MKYNNGINRLFIETKRFIKDRENLNLNDDDLRVLQYMLLKNTKVGDVIAGTGRLRKMRFSIQNKGKKGGARVCYVDFEEKEKIALIAAYAKNVKDDLTKEEKKSIKIAITFLEKEL